MTRGDAAPTHPEGTIRATGTGSSRPPTATEPEGLYEVVEGQIVEKPLMGSNEADVAAFLTEVLAPFARSEGLGRVFPEMHFRIDTKREFDRRPDVAFVSNDRCPSDRTAADAAKVEEDFRAGAKRV